MSYGVDSWLEGGARANGEPGVKLTVLVVPVGVTVRVVGLFGSVDYWGRWTTGVGWRVTRWPPWRTTLLPRSLGERTRNPGLAHLGVLIEFAYGLFHVGRAGARLWGAI